jgi:hypothetical protein
MCFYMEQNGISMDIHYQSLQWHWNVTHFDSGGYGCQRSKCLFSLRSSNDVIDTWAFADDSDVEHITYILYIYYIDLIIRYHVVYPSSGLAETASQPAPLICCGKENTNIQQLWQIVWADAASVKRTLPSRYIGIYHSPQEEIHG